METIPCLGAVNISLLEVPTVDLALMLINKMDIMAFPGLNMAVNLGLKMVSSMPFELPARLRQSGLARGHALSLGQTN